jgi:hypothetical protein
MIYINQIGYCEVGRGETLTEAIADAAKWGFEIDPNEIREWRQGWPCLTGEVVWMDERQEDYQWLFERRRHDMTTDTTGIHQ